MAAVLSLLDMLQEYHHAVDVREQQIEEHLMFALLAFPANDIYQLFPHRYHYSLIHRDVHDFSVWQFRLVPVPDYQ